jgi:hypothetical protein
MVLSVDVPKDRDLVEGCFEDWQWFETLGSVENDSRNNGPLGQ